MGSVTVGPADLYLPIKNAVVATVKDLSLPGILQRVFPRLALDLSNEDYPCCLVVPPASVQAVGALVGGRMPRETITEVGGDTGGRDWVFPFVVCFFDRDSPRSDEREGKYVTWQAGTLGALSRDRAKDFQARVPQVWNLATSAGILIAGPHQTYLLLASAVALEVTARIPTG
jgi:hypothetical protein